MLSIDIPRRVDHMCIVIPMNLPETYLIVVISIPFSGKPFIRCFQNHCYTLALNAYPLAGSHLSMIPYKK